nr:MAG TPA: restriction endonuclease [Bacteriophage sp.]
MEWVCYIERRFMADVSMKTCAKCGKTKKETDFYKIPNTDERCDLCKTCLTMYIDNRRPDTFKWILKKMDVPYIEKKWVELANRSYMKNPATFGPMSVIGTYLRTMNMDQYNNLKYADSEKINNEKFQQAKKEQQNIKGTSYDEEFENRLLESLKAGEISQAEYNTMSRKSVLDRINEKMRQGEEEVASNPDSVLDKKELEVPENTVDSEEIKKNADVISAAKDVEQEFLAKKAEEEKKIEQEFLAKKAEEEKKKKQSKEAEEPEPQVLDLMPDVASSLGVNPVENISNAPLDITGEMQNDFIPDVARIDEAQITESLTEDDIKYLSLKWGLLYKPSEWVKMEELYQKYAADYELSTDREQVLKNICKTDLKMNQALDVGDIKTFKDLQGANDMLRKSGKFTDSQKQEEKKRDIDSIGELVAFVESKGGIIPRKDDPINVPQDKIDFIINDMKNYTDNLVKNELGLGNLIESYIKKLEENKTKSVDEIIAEGIKTDEDNAVTDEEAADFQQFQIEEREEEAKRLAEQYGAE